MNENEIAQTRGAFGHDVMANVWMHNGFLQVEGEKMSKSLGNFVTIHELLNTERFGGRKWPGEVLRLAMLRTHYRQPIDFTVKALEEAKATIDDWGRATTGVSPSVPTAEFVDALSDDLNFAKAEAHLHMLRKSEPAALAANANFIGLVLPRFISSDLAIPSLTISSGHVTVDAHATFGDHIDAEVISIRERVDKLITVRNAARAAKNWAESDRIRDELAAMGVALKDNKDGTTTWEVKR